MKSTKTIALIDDDDIFIFLITKIIKVSNLIDSIIVFGNGKEAITFLSENVTNPHLLPEIILLDLSMPIMDGWQFLEGLTKLDPHIEKKITIYICTSSISPDDLNKAKNIPYVTDFLIKPVTKEKLIEILEK